MGTILDLPIEEQKEITKEFGMEFEEWKIFIQEMLDEMQEYSKEIETVYLTGKEAEEYLKEHGDFYARCFT